VFANAVKEKKKDGPERARVCAHGVLNARAVRSHHGLAGGVAVFNGKAKRRQPVKVGRTRGCGARRSAPERDNARAVTLNCTVQRRPASAFPQLQPGAARKQ